MTKCAAFFSICGGCIFRMDSVRDGALAALPLAARFTGAGASPSASMQSGVSYYDSRTICRKYSSSFSCSFTPSPRSTSSKAPRVSVILLTVAFAPI